MKNFYFFLLLFTSFTAYGQTEITVGTVEQEVISDHPTTEYIPTDVVFTNYYSNEAYNVRLDGEVWIVSSETGEGLGEIFTYDWPSTRNLIETIGFKYAIYESDRWSFIVDNPSDSIGQINYPEGVVGDFRRKKEEDPTKEYILSWDLNEIIGVWVPDYGFVPIVEQ